MKRFLLTLLIAFSLWAPCAIAQDETSLRAVKEGDSPVSAPATLQNTARAKDAAEQPLLLAVDRAEKIELPEAADTVFVASPDIADVQVISPTTIMIYGRGPGQTTLTASRKDGTFIIQRRVVVDKDLGKLQDVLGQMLPKIRALPVPGGIVLSGEAESSSQAADAQRIAKKFLGKDKDEVINRLRVEGSEQIQLRVRVAEVSKSVNKVFGINWDMIGMGAGFTLGLQTGASFFSAATGAFTRVGNNSAAFGGYGGEHFKINSLVDALADDGLVTLLAEPNLTAKSGETATFLSGGEFPIPVPQENGAVTVVFKPYGVSLAFTPTVVGKDRISVHVRPEVSQLTNTGSITLNNITIPALITRRAETTVELGSGHTFAIGGLIRSSQNNDVRKFPLLGDMPVLGALFRSTQFQNDQSELVILVTPYIVHPSSTPLAAPTDGYAPANDIERIVGGYKHEEGIPNMPLTNGVRLDGPVGFMAE
ncbi:MAG TPA: type II and III secretion system protein family protein [Alphaproteobacteria bacterium]|nr:type II and III secretion system protein family protein [Alphaproteobacteria bacterium]